MAPTGTFVFASEDKRILCGWPHKATLSGATLEATSGGSGGLLLTLDPETTVGGLLAAIPSAVVAFRALNIPIQGNEERSLQSMCAEHGVSLKDLLSAIDQIDWGGESPLR